jgi:DNA-binding LacI/PurR family transcriptional regulator
MGAALAAQQQAGMLSRRPDGRSVVGDGGETERTLVKRSLLRETRLSFEQDILNGRYSRNENLPSFKELQARYGVCYRSVRKILSEFLAEGIVVPYLRGFRLSTSPAGVPHGSIVYVSQAGLAVSGESINDRSYRLFERLEIECALRNITLRSHDVDYYSPATSPCPLPAVAESETVLGYIVDLWWFDIEDYRTNALAVLGALGRSRKPVTIVDQMGEFDADRSLAPNGLYRILRLAGTSAGEAMGRCLLSLGHRRVAYLSSDHSFAWSHQRLEGLRRVFAQAGLENGVVPAVSHLADTRHAQLLALSDLPEETMEKIIFLGRTEAEARHLLAIYRELRSDPRWIPKDDRLLQRIKLHVRFAEPLLQSGLDPDYQIMLFQYLFGVAEKHMGAWLGRPLFEQLTSDRTITAWVCSHDGLATHAMEFLREKRIAVPDSISVVGFDNNSFAKAERISSFDFRTESFVSQALAFIERPPHSRSSRNVSSVEIEGSFVPRDTTAPPGAN